MQAYFKWISLKSRPVEIVDVSLYVDIINSFALYVTIKTFERVQNNTSELIEIDLLSRNDLTKIKLLLVSSSDKTRHAAPCFVLLIPGRHTCTKKPPMHV